MIAKITKRASFMRLVSYANRAGDARLIYYKDVRADNNHTIARSMQGQATDKIGRALRLPVYHVSLSFAQQDKENLSDETMVKIALDYLQKMNLTNTQYIICRHFDKPHPHVHIVLNRVDNNGHTISDRNDRIRSIRVCRELTNKYGLFVPKGKENVKRKQLRGKDKVKYTIYDIAQKALSDCHDWRSFRDRLRANGITLHFRVSKDGRVMGIVFSMGNHTFSGSHIDKSLSFSRIDAQFTASLSRALCDHCDQENNLKNIISNVMAQQNKAIMTEEDNEQQTTFNQADTVETPSPTAVSLESNGASYTTAASSTAMLVAAEAIIDLAFPSLEQMSTSGGPSQNTNSETEDERRKKKRKSYKRRM